MTFLAPTMLFGALAVSIPLALHFFYRARYKPLPWAPMRFLKEAIEQTSRRLKFQEWILLALRCLAIILLALAIARPGSTSTTVAGRGTAIDTALVFDTSYSMGASQGSKTRLELAKEAALEVLKTLPSKSSVQIITCSGTERAKIIGPQERYNLDQARQLIPNIETTSLSTDLLPGLTEALAAVNSGTAPAKEIYVFTDMEKSGFQRQQEAVKAKCQEIKKQANLVFVRCGTDEKVQNVAVTDVTWKTEIPHIKTRVPFVITLQNTSSAQVKGVPVTLEIDGKAVEKDAAMVDLDSKQKLTVTLTAGLDTPGVHVVGVKLGNDKQPGDQLPGDNVLYKTILVREKVRVLLVDGTPKPDNPSGSGDHFVRTALNPGRMSDYYIETDTISAAEASPRDLDGKDVVYLLNAPVRDADPVVGMSRDFIGELARVVKAGTGLVIGCGNQVNAEQYNKVLGAAGLLPFELQGIRNTTETSPFHPAADKVEEASFLAKFREQPFAESLQRVSFFSMFDVNESAKDGRVLVRTTEGRPYIASKVLGGGEVVLVTSSLDETWGNFSSEPGSFHVPFAIYTLLELTGRKVPTEPVTAGSPLVWTLPPDSRSQLQLVPPPKNGLRGPRVNLEIADSNGQRTVTTTETAHAGIYNIVPSDKADDAGPAFAVNPDLHETADMALAGDTEVEGWLGFKPAIIGAGSSVEGAVGETRTRGEWTEWVLVFLLVLLVTEAAFAWLCGRAW